MQCILACTAAFVSVRSLFPPVSGLPPSYIEPIIKELTKYIADVHVSCAKWLACELCVGNGWRVRCVCEMVGV